MGFMNDITHFVIYFANNYLAHIILISRALFEKVYVDFIQQKKNKISQKPVNFGRKNYRYLFT
jgi:hypothetical protein